MSNDKCPACGNEIEAVRGGLTCVGCGWRWQTEGEYRSDCLLVAANERAEQAERELARVRRSKMFRVNYRNPLAKGLVAYAVSDGDPERPDPAMIELVEQLTTAERERDEKDELLFAYDQTRTPPNPAHVRLLEKLAEAERERDEAQAACAVWRDLVPLGCAACKWKSRNSDDAACAFCDGHYSRFEYITNPGQPILDRLAAAETENAGLRAAIEPMAAGDLIVAQAEDGSWRWSGEPEEDAMYHWHGSYPTAADAALAGQDGTTEGAGR